MPANKNLEKYLANYAEPEVVGLCSYPVRAGKYTHCIVIPCYNESISSICRLFERVSGIETLLAVIVVNAPDSASSLSLANTRELLRALSACFSVERPLSENLILLEKPENRLPDLLLVDRCSVGRLIPDKQGVGLARKIGADIACYLYSQSLIDSPLVFNTDADVVLPESYLRDGNRSYQSPGIAALVFPFEHYVDDVQVRVESVGAGHVDNRELARVIRFYELSMRYYADSLRGAGSGYGFTTIGSTIAFDLNRYAMVRGFPKRAGGEDFYLLNKMAKVGEVLSLQTGAIRIAGRLSDRVPFGTGPALSKLMYKNSLVDLAYWYHPDIFLRLRLWLKLLKLSWCVQPGERSDTPVTFLEKLLYESGLKETEPEYAELLHYGLFIHLDQFLMKAKRQFRTQERYDKQINDWFDAFKTLKFVHFFRDNYYPSVSMLFVRDQVETIAPGLLPKIERFLSCYD
ncbi:MAG: hypothetical protein CSB48_05160 [Proteobacteria bacterium]|nr:MAG: hypothetical protein CSB48_05160 [Pseudomonadota bacterium]